MNHPLPRLFKTLTAVTAAFIALSLTACNAQTPASTAASTQAQPQLNLQPQAQAQPDEPRTYSEPALIGKVIDQFTKLPLKDAYVYGYYATSGGTLAGGSVPQESVRSFAAVTDGDGVFKLEAWDSGSRKISGTSWGTFPVLTVWKPGYEPSFLGLNSLREWRPRERNNRSYDFAKKEDPLAGYVPPVADTTAPNTLDWRTRGFQLKPVSMDESGKPIADPTFVELQRYNAISDVLRGMRFVGECGWEPYAKVLLAQHEEWKSFLKQNIPAEKLDSKGYPSPYFIHPDPALANVLGAKTTLDTYASQYAKNPASWKCSNPNNLIDTKKP